MLIVAVGYIGMIGLLIAFSFRLTMKSLYYLLINIACSVLMIFYSFCIQAYPFTVLNIIWLIAAIIQLKDQ